MSTGQGMQVCGRAHGHMGGEPYRFTTLIGPMSGFGGNVVWSREHGRSNQPGLGGAKGACARVLSEPVVWMLSVLASTHVLNQRTVSFLKTRTRLKPRLRLVFFLAKVVYVHLFWHMQCKII